MLCQGSHTRWGTVCGHCGNKVPQLGTTIGDYPYYKLAPTRPPDMSIWPWNSMHVQPYDTLEPFPIGYLNTRNMLKHMCSQLWAIALKMWRKEVNNKGTLNWNAMDKVEEANSVSFLNWTLVFDFQLSWFGGGVIYVHSVVTLMTYELVMFAKIKLHSPSSIVRSVAHWARNMLDFCEQIGQIRT